jgi:hypothetical protein
MKFLSFILNTIDVLNIQYGKQVGTSLGLDIKVELFIKRLWDFNFMRTDLEIRFLMKEHLPFLFTCSRFAFSPSLLRGLSLGNVYVLCIGELKGNRCVFSNCCSIRTPVRT